MRKTILTAIFFLLILLLTACQEEEAQPAPEPPPEEPAETVGSPEARVAEFIELWKSGDFSSMHTNYLNQGTQTVYGEANFVTWQQELHEQLGIDNLEVSYTEPAEGAEWNKEQPADFAIPAKSTSLLGMTTALTSSPWLSSGTPITAARLTAGCVISTSSTSRGYTL